MAEPLEHLSEQLLSEYLDGRLNPPVARRVQAHLAECERCRQRAQELETTVRLLQALPMLRPPRDFRLGPPARRQRLVASALPWMRVTSAIAAALFVILFMVDLLAPSPAPATSSAPKIGLAASSPTVPPSDSVTATRPAALPRSSATETEQTAGTEAFSARGGARVSALGTIVPLPTPTAADQQPGAGRLVKPLDAAASGMPRFWPWELLSGLLALIFSGATWLLGHRLRLERA